jgi:SAM-dependent methyltransferase
MRYFFLLFFLTFSLFAYEDYSKTAQLYAQNEASGTDYLAFRDVPSLINKYLLEKKDLSVLDFGCGAGLSTRFIKQVLPANSKIIGVDISKEMLSQAKLADPNGNYLLIDRTLPFSEMFDFVYCNFVLFELPTQNEITRAFKDIFQSMKKEGYLIAATATPDMYNRKNHWVTLDNNFVQNDLLKSGDIAKVSLLLPDGVITFGDYYWTEKDYLSCFQKAGFTIISVIYPLGSKDEKVAWKWQDEITTAPYVIFVLKK